MPLFRIMIILNSGGKVSIGRESYYTCTRMLRIGRA
jgi:hypothetical protein